MRIPEVIQPTLDINPKFAARVRAHRPTTEELRDAIRIDLKSAGEFIFDNTRVSHKTTAYYTELADHNDAEQAILDLVQRRKHL